MKKHLIVTAVFAAVTSVFAAAASFESAKCVWPEGREAEMNGFCRFRASFDAAEGAKAVLRATAGYDYRARLNGAFAGFGPARSVPGMWRVDEWPLAAKPGRNIVEIDVAGYNCNSFYLTDQTPFLCAEILVDGKVVAATVKDGGFSAETTGRVRRVPRFSYQRPFMEVYRLPHEPERLALAEQPERRWLAREWAYPSFALTKPFRAVSLEKVVYDASIEPKTGRHVVKNRDDYKLFPLDVLEENPYSDIQRLRTVSRGEAPLQENGWFRIGRDEGVVFEGEREAAGFPVFKVRCDEPVDVYLTFDEMLSPDGSVDPFRAETVGTAVWHLGAGEHELEGFEPVAFKAARILVRGASAALAAPRVRTYESPCADRASFRASDPALSVIFEAAKRSYAANAVDCRPRRR